MKGNFRKVIGGLLSISLLCGVLPMVAMAGNADRIDFDKEGYAWLEETDNAGAYGFSKDANDSDGFSGGKGLGIKTNSTPSADKGGAWYIDFYVNVPETGSYDIWIHGTSPDNKWASTPKLQINGEEVATTKVGGESWDDSNNWVYCWNKATVTLEEGSLDLRYFVDAKRTGDNANYYAVLDMICIVPSSYGWTQSITDKPVNPNPDPEPEPDPGIDYKEFDAEGYAWLEETDNAEAYGFSKDANDSDGFSGGKGLGIKTNSTPSADKGGAWYIDFYVNVPETGSYDIWIHGTSPDNKWASTPKLQINGEEVATTKVGGESWDDSNNWVYCWNKATVTLEEGSLDLRYFVDAKRTGDNANYYAVLDMICIVPSSYGWIQSITDKPVKRMVIDINPYSVVWIDAKDSVARNGVTIISDDLLNGSEGATVGTSTAPTDTNQYYLEFELNAEDTAEYDIFLRGSSDRDKWNSEPTVNVNGTDYKITDMGYDEGWVNTNYNVAWSKIENVTIPAGQSSLKWIVKTSRTASTEYYVSIFDAFVVLPHGTPFKPVSKNLPNTKLDAEISIMLAGENIYNPKENVSLPSVTAGGKSILWSTSDANVFDTNGNIRRDWYDNSVTVTAVLGNNEYTRVFDVLVSKLVEFALDGELNVGDTSVSATVYFDEEAVDKDTTIISALYGSDGTLKQLNSAEKSFSMILSLNVLVTCCIFKAILTS